MAFEKLFKKHKDHSAITGKKGNCTDDDIVENNLDWNNDPRQANRKYNFNICCLLLSSAKRKNMLSFSLLNNRPLLFS